MNIALTTQETLGLMKESLAKNVTIQTGLTAYDLQAPAKNLYPTITPLRNSIPESGGSTPATRPTGVRFSPRPALASMRWAGFRKGSVRRACPIRRSPSPCLT